MRHKKPIYQAVISSCRRRQTSGQTSRDREKEMFDVDTRTQWFYFKHTKSTTWHPSKPRDIRDTEGGQPITLINTVRDQWKCSDVRKMIQKNWYSWHTQTQKNNVNTWISEQALFFCPEFNHRNSRLDKFYKKQAFLSIRRVLVMQGVLMSSKCCNLKGKIHHFLILPVQLVVTEGKCEFEFVCGFGQYPTIQHAAWTDHKSSHTHMWLSLNHKPC